MCSAIYVNNKKNNSPAHLIDTQIKKSSPYSITDTQSVDPKPNNLIT